MTLLWHLVWLTVAAVIVLGACSLIVMALLCRPRRGLARAATPAMHGAAMTCRCRVRETMRRHPSPQFGQFFRFSENFAALASLSSPVLPGALTMPSGVHAIAELRASFVADNATEELVTLARSGDRAGFDALASCLMATEQIAECWTGVRVRLGMSP